VRRFHTPGSPELDAAGDAHSWICACSLFVNRRRRTCGERRGSGRRRCNLYAVIAALNRLAQRATGTSRLVVYYSGHGQIRRNIEVTGSRTRGEHYLRQPGLLGGPISFRAAANRLNERNIASIMGTRWTGQQVLRMSLRLGIKHPRRMSTAAARSRVRSIWEQNPGVTGSQVIASLGKEDLLGIRRACELLREFRLADAKRSRSHAQMSWRIDCRSAVRLRIRAIWVRQPELTAQEVWSKLGARDAVDVWYVRQILNECWRASGSHTREALRKGRRVYGRYWPRRSLAPSRRRVVLVAGRAKSS
jgi:hypothetical protein